MDNDGKPKHNPNLKVVSVVGRTRKASRDHWVQGIPGIPATEALQETLSILQCITGLSKKALEKPADAQALLRATYYLSGMAKAMLDARMPGLTRPSAPLAEEPKEERETE